MAKEPEKPSEDQALSEAWLGFVKGLSQAMTPHSRAWGKEYALVVATVILLGVVVALLPLLSVAPFKWDGALPNGPIAAATAERFGEKRKREAIKLIVHCSYGTLCSTEEREAAAAALTSIETTAAKRSERTRFYKDYTQLVPIIIGSLLVCGVLLAVVLAQMRLAVRSWHNTLGELISAPMNKMSYALMWSIALGIFVCVPLLAHFGPKALLHAVAFFSDPFWAPLITIVAAAAIGFISAIHNRKLKWFERVLMSTPGHVTGIAAALGYVAVLFGLSWLEKSGAPIDQFSTYETILFCLLGAVSSAATAITLLLIYSYAEYYPKPSKMNELTRSLKDLPLGDGKPMPRLAVKLPNAGQDLSTAAWDMLRSQPLAPLVARQKDLPSSGSLTPKDVQANIAALTTTLSAIFLVVLLAIGFLVTDIAAEFGESDPVLKAARDGAVQSYLLLVGFGFSTLLVVTTYWAGIRLAPYRSAQDDAPKSSSSAGSEATALPWVMQESSQNEATRQITPLHPVLDPQWQQQELERRTKAKASKDAADALAEQDEQMIKKFACDAAKFRLLIRSNLYGGSLQDMLHSLGQSQLVGLIKIASPAALGSALAFFS